MPLSAGDKLGPYEILAPIGKGGMGEVYRARDPRLNRDVAVKVCTAQFSERFEREAIAIAALNHPNICQIYDVGPSYLVMELIEGESPTGPMPLAEALRIARQIADALEAAHDKGITHRDLKPGNIKIKPDGTLKVLDFGLAKIGRAAGSSGENSPTLNIGMTEAGMILGTVAYMAPEQARGKETVDKRADIWAFGVVLYELLTGKRLFPGEDVGQTLAEVIMQEPDLSAAPAKVLPLLKRCLEKDPKKRLRDIGDMDLLLADAPAAPARSQSRREWLWLGIAAMFMLVAALALSFVHFRATPPEQPRVQFGIPLPGKATNAMFEISPDGHYLAIVGLEGNRSQLWIRPLDSGEARLLTGTEGATYPFFSPDSANIGFFADGKLKKIAVSGGAPQTLCEAPGFGGGAWNQDGVILFNNGGGFRRVSASGGVPVEVTKAASGERQGYPVFLPDGRRFLFAITGDKPETIGLYAGSLAGTPPVRLLPDFSSAAYVPGSASERNGHLLFRRGTTLMAQPFDPGQAKLSGEVFPVAEQVGVSLFLGHGAFSASAKGTLVYRSGFTFGDIREVVWLDRTGKRLGILGKPGSMRNLALSPDEKQVAVDIADPQSGVSDIWILDIARGAMSRFTFGPGLITGPVWSPDGGSIAFSSRGAPVSRDLYWKPVTGAGEQELLVSAAGQNAVPYDWSRDGRFLVYGSDGDKRPNRDLWLLEMTGVRKPAPYLEAPYTESLGQFSPDGKWMAYVSNESGQDQVYVRAIPSTRPPVQVSVAGGSQPRWRSDGRELFYVSTNQKLMAVPTRFNGIGVESGTPRPLFDFVAGLNVLYFNYQPAADGQRFLVLAPPADEAPAPITVVLNWKALKK